MAERVCSPATAAEGRRLDWDPNAGLPQLVAERNGSGTLLRRYRQGLATVSMDTAGSPSYYHYDGLGSVVNLTSASGVTQWTYAYLPYDGVRTETKNQNQAPLNVLRFSGELLDPTGLYYLRARSYDPGSGRFLSTDPASAGPSDPYVSAYAYANGNPVRFVDPTGRDTYALCFGGQAVAGFGIAIQFCVVATTDLELGITVTPAALFGTPNGGYGGVIGSTERASIRIIGCKAIAATTTKELPQY